KLSLLEPHQNIYGAATQDSTFKTALINHMQCLVYHYSIATKDVCVWALEHAYLPHYLLDTQYRGEKRTFYRSL
ncbi:hypothetical protein J6590_101467, partial [Homalodisca vitripennis]